MVIWIWLIGAALLAIYNTFFNNDGPLPIWLIFGISLFWPVVLFIWIFQLLQDRFENR